MTERDSSAQVGRMLAAHHLINEALRAHDQLAVQRASAVLAAARRNATFTEQIRFERAIGYRDDGTGALT